MSHVLRRLDATEFDRVRALLTSEQLPTADFMPSRVTVWGAFAGDDLVGAIGLERCEDTGLVRSLVVKPELRRTGLARRLHARLATEAHADGLRALYALTQTAEAFFTHLAYRRIERHSVPEAVRATAEFSHLCPSTAVVLWSPLAP